jgi:membrane-associated phospholipid phosphatase
MIKWPDFSIKMGLLYDAFVHLSNPKGLCMAQINTFEIVINQFFQNIGEWLRLPMLTITALGYEEFFILLLPTLYWCVDQMVGLRLGIVLMLANVSNTFFKFLFHNPRPYWVSDDVIVYSHETSFGLPSGHAQIAASVWGWLSYETKKLWFTLVALGLILLIGISRIYLGVHFTSDVLLGWSLGAILVFAFAAWYQQVGKWLASQSDFAKFSIVLGSTVLMIVLVLGAKWTADPWVMPDAWSIRAGDVGPYDLDGIFTIAGTWFGMLTGFVILMRKRGPFLAGEGEWRRLVRLFVGFVGIMALYLGLGEIFPRNADLISFALRFVRYTLIGLWVSWLGPLVFERLGLLKFVKE